MPTFVSPFTGTVVTPTDVSYLPLAFSSDVTLAWPSEVNPPEYPAARIIDCVASTSGLIITLPPADEGTQGADILFRNLGAFTFIVQDAAGGETLSVPVGIAKYLYLQDNTSVGGEWGNVTFGAGTSYADATTLAGYGLTTINGKLAVSQNIVEVSSSPTINDASRASTFIWDGGAGTFTLPSSETLSTGWFIGFRNNGTGTLAITPTSPNTLNGQQSINVNPGDSGWLLLDTLAGGFVTVGLISPTSASFTAATYDVDAIVGNTLNLTSYAPIIQTYIAQSGTRTATLAVTLPAITQLYIFVNDTNQTGYNVSFQNQGSSQPPLVVPTGNVLTVLSDGESLYPLTSSSTGLYYANNGSAGAPSFSFNNDTTTGMYLFGTGILGLTANGTIIGKLDNSNLSAPLITLYGQLNAELISGGTF